MLNHSKLQFNLGLARFQDPAVDVLEVLWICLQLLQHKFPYSAIQKPTGLLEFDAHFDSGLRTSLPQRFAKPYIDRLSCQPCLNSFTCNCVSFIHLLYLLVSSDNN